MKQKCNNKSLHPLVANNKHLLKYFSLVTLLISSEQNAQFGHYSNPNEIRRVINQRKKHKALANLFTTRKNTTKPIQDLLVMVHVDQVIMTCRLLQGMKLLPCICHG